MRPLPVVWKKIAGAYGRSITDLRPFPGRWPTRWYLKVSVMKDGKLRTSWEYWGKPSAVAIREAQFRAVALGPERVWLKGEEFDKGTLLWQRDRMFQNPEDWHRGGKTALWQAYHQFTPEDIGLLWVLVKHRAEKITIAGAKLRTYIPEGLEDLKRDWRAEMREVWGERAR